MKALIDLTDERLVQMMVEGDRSAFETLFVRHERKVHHVALPLVRSLSLADDITQETFIAAWRGARTYKPEMAPVPAWLCAIARYRAVDALRRRDSQQRRADDLARVPRFEPPSAQRIAEAREATRDARAALTELPDEQRRVVELVYFGGLTQNEIATADGVPLGTVKGRMRLGLSKLRPLLAQHAT